MPRQMVEALVNNYRRDLKDYEELLKDVRAFAKVLEEEVRKSPKEKRDSMLEAGNTLEPGQEENKAGNEEGATNRVPAGFEEELINFTKRREKIFARLYQRAQESAEIQKKACTVLGISSFSAENIKPHLPEVLVEEIRHFSDSLGKVIKEVLNWDERLIKQLRMELEYVKLELHRIRGAEKSRNIYESREFKEARFIDKFK